MDINGVGSSLLKRILFIVSNFNIIWILASFIMHFTEAFIRIFIVIGLSWNSIAREFIRSVNRCRK